MIYDGLKSGWKNYRCYYDACVDTCGNPMTNELVYEMV